MRAENDAPQTELSGTPGYQLLEPPRENNFTAHLEWHLFINGTRPDGRPGFHGREWTAEEFIGALENALRNDRRQPHHRGEARGDVAKNLRNWLAGTRCHPRWLSPIQQVLFADNPHYNDWRAKLRHAHRNQTMRAGRARLSRETVTTDDRFPASMHRSGSRQADPAQPQGDRQSLTPTDPTVLADRAKRWDSGSEPQLTEQSAAPRFFTISGSQATSSMIEECVRLDGAEFNPAVCATLAQCMEWWRHNPNIYLLVLDRRTGRVAGYINHMAVTAEVANKIMSGKLVDPDIYRDDISLLALPGLYRLLVCSIVVGEEFRLGKALLVLFNAFLDRICQYAADDVYFSDIIADAFTGHGRQMCAHLGMASIRSSEHGSTIYHLQLIPPGVIPVTSLQREVYRKYSEKSRELAGFASTTAEQSATEQHIYFHPLAPAERARLHGEIAFVEKKLALTCPDNPAGRAILPAIYQAASVFAVKPDSGVAEVRAILEPIIRNLYVEAFGEDPQHGLTKQVERLLHHSPVPENITALMMTIIVLGNMGAHNANQKQSKEPRRLEYSEFKTCLDALLGVTEWYIRRDNAKPAQSPTREAN